jgi:hypothetical protein
VVYSTEQKAFTIESGVRNGRKVNDEWSRLMQYCLSFHKLCFHECLDRPGKSGNNNKKGCERPTKSTPKVVDAVEKRLFFIYLEKGIFLWNSYLRTECGKHERII